MIIANNNELREQLITLALQQYNKKYIHGQMGPNTFDCAGLIWFLYNEIFSINIFEEGIGLSTTTKIMTSKYGKLTLFNESDLNKDTTLVKKGDILFFHRQSLNDEEPKETNKYPGHCGIYLGENSFIHASRPKKESNYYKPK